MPVRDAFPEDKVNRAFTAAAPDQLWVADITYVKTHSGWVYAAFILDMSSRRVVGWLVGRVAMGARRRGDPSRGPVAVPER